MRSLQSLRVTGGSALSLALFFCATLGISACGTEQVEPDVLRVGHLTTGTLPEAGQGAWLTILTSSDDCSPVATDCASYRLEIDGHLLVWEDGDEYVETYAVGGVGFIISAGPHVVRLMDAGGRAVVTTAAIDMRVDTMQTLAIFGAPSSLEQHWFLDDPSLVVAGTTHVRLLNALSNHDPIQPLRCMMGLQEPCTALSAPLAHGEVFEVDSDSSSDALDALGWRWVPGGAGAVINAMGHASSGGFGPLLSTSSYRLSVPLHLLPADSQCPSCIWEDF